MCYMLLSDQFTDLWKLFLHPTITKNYSNDGDDDSGGSGDGSGDCYDNHVI